MTTSTHWVRRSLLVICCLGLLAAIGAVFTQIVAARVPEQRATLEKLITDRTGLAVRFDNVHFAWGMDGTSAVFERVELTDPVRGRVRVTAPELRVEFDTWDFLRHQQFSLGHVTLKSPDIDIIGEPEPGAAPTPARTARNATRAAHRELDEAAMVRRFTDWAELMPMGRVEVESARVHLYRRGDHVARHNFTLSQAVVSRGSRTFNAFGTMLLSQDIGQSLFVSAKLDDLGGGGANGQLRLIARRVFLDKLVAVTGIPLAARGRGTVDAGLTLRDGRVHDGRWQLSARELQLPRGTRFDHFTVQGRLSRAAGGFQFDLSDLQLTRGARLERTPKILARVTLVPGTLRAERITATADRVPFMAAEFLGGALSSAPAEPTDAGMTTGATGWIPTAGELRNVRFDSRADTFSAQVVGAEIARPADDVHPAARLGELAARVEAEGAQVRLVFDATQSATLRLGDGARELKLAGMLTLHRQTSELDFAGLRLASGEASLVADGRWSTGENPGAPLSLELAAIDRALLGDVWSALSLPDMPPLTDVNQGRIVRGTLSLVAMRDAGAPAVDWQHSRGSLQLAGLSSAGADVPRLSEAAGNLDFARGGARLNLDAGLIEDLRLTTARVDWPRRGAPRLRATAQGGLDSPLLRRALQDHGLEKLSGRVTLEAEARGEEEMRDPDAWRITARIEDAAMPLASDLPRVEKLGGTVRLAAGQLRGLELEGQWLGGPVRIESRRAGARGVTSADLSGEADAAPLLKWLGQPDAASLVNGHLTWGGTLQRREQGWQATLGSNLAGVESRLPEPFDKSRGRALAITADLRFDTRGIQEFEVESGRDAIRGRVVAGTTNARFELQGVSGELVAAAGSAEPRLNIDRLDLRRAPTVLAAAGAVLSADADLVVDVAEIRHANRGLGALQATLARRANAVEFTLESADGAPHELSATGKCVAGNPCRMEFSLQTRQLPALLADARLPAEWPTQSLRAAGELAWSGDAGADITGALSGNFELETQGADSGHQLMASARLADGRIELSNVQGTGPDPDQVFRGSGQVGLLARTYDLTVDYEQVSLAASAMPTPARMRLSRAWNSLRGSAARQGWAETEPARRVQWHGSWD